MNNYNILKRCKIYEKICILTKVAVIKKLPNGDYRVLSENGKNLGTYNSESEAKKRLKQIEYFKHIDSNSAADNVPDGSSFSSIMRKLRDSVSPKEVMFFLKIHKKNFDEAVKEGLKNPHEYALNKSLKSHKNIITISKFLYDDATIFLKRKKELTNKNIVLNGDDMIKKGYSIQMTYDVSDNEKMQAEKALLYFNHTNKLLNMASDHLNIMKTPFKDNPEMSPDDVMKARAAIRRFRDRAIENFNDFKIASFKCVNIMKNFSSDTQTLKVMKSFIASIETLENSVNELVDLFGDLKSKDFASNVVKNIEDIQKQCEEIEEIIQDRVKNHIQSNILARSWVDSVSKDLQMKIEQKTPLILDLYNKRQEQLNNLIKEKTQV